MIKKLNYSLKQIGYIKIILCLFFLLLTIYFFISFYITIPNSLNTNLEGEGPEVLVVGIIFVGLATGIAMALVAFLAYGSLFLTLLFLTLIIVKIIKIKKNVDIIKK